jgi:uncharacterized membrane protein
MDRKNVEAKFKLWNLYKEFVLDLGALIMSVNHTSVTVLLYLEFFSGNSRAFKLFYINSVSFARSRHIRQITDSKGGENASKSICLFSY